MLLSPFVHAVRQKLKRRDQRERDQTADNCEVVQAGLAHRITSFRLEADVLERLGGVPIETSRESMLAAPRGQIALGDPRGSAVAGRGKLVERALCGGKRDFGFIEAVLLQQRTS